LAIKYSVSNPRIATTLFSTTRTESVLNNISWAEAVLDEDLLREVQTILEPRYRDTWLNS
jgi:aryl-alcohol dehydrogenase-like predicted oxidoreductase